jgi:diguanylate cyclase (GGDEF)-like protein
MDSPLRKIHSSSFWLKIFVAVVCLAIVGLEGWRDWNERQEEFAGIQTEMKNLAKSLAQHAEDTLNLADAILVDTVDRIETQGANPQAIAGMEAFFAERVQSLQALKSLTVYGEDGFVISSSLSGHGRVNVRDRAFFQHHAATTGEKWFFGPMIKDPLGGDRVLTLSRRFNKPDGSFGGVVQVGIPPRYFANFFGRFDLGSEGSVTMLNTADAMVLSRYPYLDGVIGVKQASFEWLAEETSYGLRAYVSPLDGVARLAAYQRNHVYPVVLVAAVSQQEALARWTEGFRIRFLGVAVLVCITGALGWRLARELRRREEVEAELAVLARTDGLTGLANRRAFDGRLQTEWLRASRDGTFLSLLLIDVDQFKAYNDRYGHQRGDECLRKVAQVISIAMKRPGDFVARYGGEEIVVLLPDTDEAGAAAVAEQIRAQVEEMALHHEANPPSNILTISIGSVTLKPAFERSRIDATELVHQADKALYRAKQSGRNRVAVAQAA